MSLEVIEHLTDVRAFAATFLSLIAPGGIGFLTTPYHGYWKNLAIAAADLNDRHFTDFWKDGHIKFFSVRSLQQLLHEAGADKIAFQRVGRWPRAFAKSLVAVVGCSPSIADD